MGRIPMHSPEKIFHPIKAERYTGEHETYTKENKVDNKKETGGHEQERNCICNESLRTKGKSDMAKGVGNRKIPEIGKNIGRLQFLPRQGTAMKKQERNANEKQRGLDGRIPCEPY
ncbi:MAG: hypothetical protein QXJ27_03510 [Thermoplasmata archaeon]